MSSHPDRQIVLRPQDFVMLLKLAVTPHQLSFTYAEIAGDLGIAASAAHAGLRRAKAAKLILGTPSSPAALNRAGLREFVIHGAKYAYPATAGPEARGIPTSFAALPLSEVIAQSSELMPVWPCEEGTTRGLALYPLYPAVPFAARRDQPLYEVLALFDALRTGAARERELATQELVRRLS
jgi:hypothetical protein